MAGETNVLEWVVVALACLVDDDVVAAVSLIDINLSLMSSSHGPGQPPALE